MSEAAVPISWREFGGVAAERRPTPDPPNAIASLLGYGDQIRAEGLARAERRLQSMSPEARRMVEALVARIVDQFLQIPATRLQEAAASPEGIAYARVLQGLFGADASAR